MIVDVLEFRYLVCAPDLNAHGTLHGGVLLRWIDEATGMHARKLTNRVNVTRAMSKIDFISKVKLGEIVLIKSTLNSAGRTSLSFSVDCSEDISARNIAKVQKIVFVAIDQHGNPVDHGVDVAKG
tara:strand:+ start:993 stop:1367 length:375 start_codon:yes stop_codon:yes gene_type:complete